MSGMGATKRAIYNNGYRSPNPIVKSEVWVHGASSYALPDTLRGDNTRISISTKQLRYKW